MANFLSRAGHNIVRAASKAVKDTGKAVAKAEHQIAKPIAKAVVAPIALVAKPIGHLARQVERSVIRPVVTEVKKNPLEAVAVLATGGVAATAIAAPQKLLKSVRGGFGGFKRPSMVAMPKLPEIHAPSHTDTAIHLVHPSDAPAVAIEEDHAASLAATAPKVQLTPHPDTATREAGVLNLNRKHRDNMEPQTDSGTTGAPDAAPATEAAATAEPTDWKKYLPYIIGAVVLLLLIVMLSRKKSS